MTDIDTRWQTYRELVPLNQEPKDSKAKSLRDELILEHLELATRVANKMLRSMPDHIQRGDIESYAIIGLIRAISRYDPAFGVPFESYARTNMRSVILDSIRALDWAPRSLRKQERELNVAKQQLIQELGRTPLVDDLAKKLNLTSDNIAEINQKSYMSGVTSLHEYSDPDAANSFSKIPSSVDIEEQVFARQIMQLIANIVSRLPFKEAVVVALHYYQGKKLAEVAECLGISEVKAGFLHSEAVSKIWQGIENARNA